MNRACMHLPCSSPAASTKSGGRCLLQVFAIAAMIELHAAAADITAQWIGVGYGDWANPTNWQNGLVPTNSQTDKFNVILDLPNSADFAQSALTQPMAVSQLTLGKVLYVYSASGVGSVEFDVQDNFDWVGGSLSGWAAQYHLYGESLFEGNTTKTLDRTCTLILHGHARWTQGNLAWGGYGQVTVNPGASLEMFTGGSVGSPTTTDSADIYNQGTIRLNAPGQTAQFFGIVHHSGLIDVQAGDLQFMWKYDGPGGISVQPGARLIFSGPGQWQTVPQSGGGQLVFNGREQELVTDSSFACFTRVGANFFGNGNFTLSNAVWEGGQITGPGSLLVPANGNLAVQGRAAQLDRNLLNAGEISVGPGAWLYCTSNPVHTNSISGEIHLASASYFGLNTSPAGVLVNQGNILKDDSGLGAAGFYASLQNQGLVRSTAGKLVLAPAGQNAGRFEAAYPGQIEATGFDFADTSMLIGDGQISLVGGTLRGAVDTNLNIKTAGGVTVLNTNLYSFKTLQVEGWLSFPQTSGAEVREFLTLHGSLYGGLLRSLQNTELSFGSAQIQGGSRLELLGQSALVQGSLSIQDSNSTLVNYGTMRGSGTSDLVVYPGASFENQGAWRVSAQLGSFRVVLSDTVCRFSTSNPSFDLNFYDGPFQIAGPVVAMPRQIIAGPGAQLSLTDLAVTNASILLSQSSLTVTNNVRSSNATFILDQGSMVGPPTPWTGSALFAGQGDIQASLALQTLQLLGTSNGNDLVVNGSVSVTGTNALLRAIVMLNNGTPSFPYMQVHGPLTLNANLDLVASFVPNPTNFMAGPIILLESDRSIAGGFLNATNGAILATATNSYRCQVFYGTNSPFGPNKVVLVGFGTAFDRWRMQRFSSQQLQEPLIAGPTADPDHNGWDNITEFVLAIDSGSAGSLLPSLQPGTDGYTTIHLRKRKDIGGLQVTIALSPDLFVWQETLLGASPSWMELHRVFDLGSSYDYSYRYPRAPRVLFLKITVGGQY